MDHLVYHYTGGVALTALKLYNAAEEFFDICASAPVGSADNFRPMQPGMGGPLAAARYFGGSEPSAIQMDALKKLTLVQLISYGKVRAGVQGVVGRGADAVAGAADAEVHAPNIDDGPEELGVRHVCQGVHTPAGRASGDSREGAGAVRECTCSHDGAGLEC
jgi:hypothetical protein